MKRLPCKYQLGAVVYHRMDPDAGAGMVVDVRFGGDGGVVYSVAFGARTPYEAYELELTTAKSWAVPDGEGGTTTTESEP